MRRALILALAVLLAPLAMADMVDDCEQAADPDLRIGGCTAIIRSGQYSGKNLARVYNKRGIANDDLGEYTRAIADYDQALRLNPGDAVIYNNRGIVYCKLGKAEAAFADWSKANEADPDSARREQESLRDAGLYTGPIDGNFGPASKAALRAFTEIGCF